MSNRARVILCSGTRAALATRLADASAAQCTDIVARARLTDEPHDAVVRAAEQGVGALVGRADALPREVWACLPGLPEISLLLRICDEASQGRTVIVDAGSLEGIVRLAAIPAQALRVLDAVLTAELAMQHTAGQTGPYEVLSALRADIGRALRLLRSSQAVARLAADVSADAVHDLMQADSALGVHGVGVDAFIVMRGKGERDDADELVGRLRPLGAAAWSTGRQCRPVPDGCTVTEVLSAPRGLRTEELDVVRDGDLLLAVVPCPADRVGIDGDEMVIEMSGTRRWIPLPAALTRCSAVSARRRRGTVEVAFRPDRTRWRPAS